MPNVYIPQFGRSFDHEQINEALLQAAKFGEPIVMLNRQDDVRRPAECLAKIRRMMATFNDDDYLIPMGSTHAMMWAAIVASSKVSVLQTLQWDIKNNQYTVLRTPMEQHAAQDNQGVQVTYRKRTSRV